MSSALVSGFGILSPDLAGSNGAGCRHAAELERARAVVSCLDLD